MTTEEQTNFDKANQVNHPVETQWHYPIMTRYGYVPLTKNRVGFVRQYTYEHPVTKIMINVITGGHSDYWSGDNDGSGGYWSSLEEHLMKLQKRELKHD